MPKTFARASQLPSIAKCPASYRECEGLPNVGSEPARRGTVAHRVAQLILEALPIDPVALSAEYGSVVAPDEIRDMEESFEWLKGIDKSAELHCEIELEAWMWGKRNELVGFIPGHADVLIRMPDENSLHVTDYKTGRLEQDAVDDNLQMMAYAVGAADWADNLSHEVSTISVTIAYTTLNRSESLTGITLDKVEEYRRVLRNVYERATAEGPEYFPGRHCEYCAARHKCKALNQALAPVLTAYPDIECHMNQIAPVEAGRIYGLAKAGAALCKDIMEAAKRRCDDEGGVLPLGNGEVLVKTEERHRHIDAVKAWDVLVATCGTHMNGVVKVSVGDVEDAAVAQHLDVNGYKRGDKKRVKEETFAMLEAADAITRKPQIKYLVKKEKD